MRDCPREGDLAPNISPCVSRPHPSPFLRSRGEGESNEQSELSCRQVECRFGDFFFFSVHCLDQKPRQMTKGWIANHIGLSSTFRPKKGQVGPASVTAPLPPRPAAGQRPRHQQSQGSGSHKIYTRFVFWGHRKRWKSRCLRNGARHRPEACPLSKLRGRRQGA